MWERRSRVTGSMVWYSSSIPMVKVGRIFAECPLTVYDKTFVVAPVALYKQKLRGTKVDYGVVAAADFFSEPFFAVVFFAGDVFFPAGAEGAAPRNCAQRSSGLYGASLAFVTASSATSLTIHSKLSAPTECRSASGAGFIKSIA